MLDEKNLEILKQLKEQLVHDNASQENIYPVKIKSDTQHKMEQATSFFSDNLHVAKNEKQPNINEIRIKANGSKRKKQGCKLGYVASAIKETNRVIVTKNEPQKTKKERRAEKLKRRQEQKERQKEAVKKMPYLTCPPHIVNTGESQYYMHNNNLNNSVYAYSGGDVRPK